MVNFLMGVWVSVFIIFPYLHERGLEERIKTQKAICTISFYKGASESGLRSDLEHEEVKFCSQLDGKVSNDK